MNYTLEGEEIFEKIVRQIKILFIPSVNNDYRPKFLQSKTLGAIVIVIFMVKILSIFLTLPLPNNVFFADITKIDLVQLLNNKRQILGISPVSENKQLDEAAMLKAKDMIQNNYFAHQSPQGITPWFWFKQAGYKYKYAGENLAIGFVNSPEVFSGWLNSPSHRTNMINPNYKEVGTAVLEGFGPNNSFVVVQLFGSPLSKPVKTITKKENIKTPVSNITSNIESRENQPLQSIAQVLGNGSNSQPSLENKNLGTSEKVLGESTGDLMLLASNDITKHSFYFNFLIFLKYGSNKILEYISYLLLGLIGVSFLLHMIISSKTMSKKLIFRSLMLVIIICVSMSITNEIISQIIPHNIVI